MVMILVKMDFMKKMIKLTAKIATLACLHPNARVVNSPSLTTLFLLWVANGILDALSVPLVTNPSLMETTLNMKDNLIAKLIFMPCKALYVRDVPSPFLEDVLQPCLENSILSILYAHFA